MVEEVVLDNGCGAGRKQADEFCTVDPLDEDEGGDGGGGWGGANDVFLRVGGIFVWERKERGGIGPDDGFL